MGLMAPKKRGGLFGSTPMILPGNGMTGTPQPMVQPMAQPMQQEPAKPKFFGEGGVGRGIAGSIGDFLLQYSGMQPIYQPAMQQRQMETSRLKEYQQRRTDTLADQRSLLEYKRANPDPDYFDDNAGNRWQINPSTGERKLIFRDPTQKHVQQVVTDPDGSQRLVQVPIPNNVNPDGTFGNASIGGMAPPIAPKGKLTPYNGGQTATPSGNF